MAYGLLTKGLQGASIFSDQVASMIFVGQPRLENALSLSLFDTGFFNEDDDGPNYEDTTSSSGGWTHIDLPSSPTRSSGTISPTPQSKPAFMDDQIELVSMEFGFSAGLNSDVITSIAADTRIREDNQAVSTFLIEAANEPEVFIEYLDFENYGAQVVRTEDTGNTGTDIYGRTVKTWRLHILMGYPAGEKTRMAIAKVNFFCFCQTESTYPAGTSYGLQIFNSSSETVYHSDLTPLLLKGIYEIGTETATMVVGSATGFAVGNRIVGGTRFGVDGNEGSAFIGAISSNTLTLRLVAGGFTVGEDITNGTNTTSITSFVETSSDDIADVTSTYQEFDTDNPTSRRAILSQDFGRFVEYPVTAGGGLTDKFQVSSRFLSLDVSTSATGNGGDFVAPVSARFPDAKGSLGSVPADASYIGSEHSAMPVIDPSDYVDTPTDINTVAIGGTTTNSGSFRYHVFKSDGTFTITTQGNTRMDVLVVGGGGMGGGKTGGDSNTGTVVGSSHGGGAGGGGVVDGEILCPDTGTYTVTVGDGDSTSNFPGLPLPVWNTAVTLANSDSTYYNRTRRGEDSSVFDITAIGGGGGGSSLSVFGDNRVGMGFPGGSGGGGGAWILLSGTLRGGGPGGANTSGQGGFGNFPTGHIGVGIDSNQQSGGGGGASGLGAGLGESSIGDGTDNDGTISSPGIDGKTIDWLPSGITGVGNIFGGGGGGSVTFNSADPSNTEADPIGGDGGGGRGSIREQTLAASTPAVAGTANTGGGGGGGVNASAPNLEGKEGGSGIVVIRYAI